MLKKIKKKLKKTKEDKEIISSKPDLSNEFIDTVEEHESRRSKRIRRYIIKPFKIISITLFLGILAIILAVVFTGLGIYVKYAHEFDKTKPQSNSTQLVIYDKDNQEVFRGYGAAEPQRVKLSELPTVVKQATLAAEDIDYYKHGALDYRSLARAVYVNWTQSNKSGWQKLSDLAQAKTYTQ